MFFSGKLLTHRRLLQQPQPQTKQEVNDNCNSQVIIFTGHSWLYQSSTENTIELIVKLITAAKATTREFPLEKE